MSRRKKSSIVGASLWMFFIAILLCWLPFIGPLVAGLVGGKKAGDVGNAVIAVFLPGALLGLAVFLFAGLFSGLPILGFVAGLGTFVLVASSVGPMLLGAIIGALLE